MISLLSLLFVSLVIIHTPALADEASQQYCDMARQTRQQIIENSATIPIVDELHHQKSAPCFSVEENYHFAALMAAEEVLNTGQAWFDESDDELQQDIRDVCAELDSSLEGYERCVNRRSRELQISRANKITGSSREMAHNRDALALSMLNECTVALENRRHLLPHSFPIPVAYRDHYTYSVPQWLLDEKMHDDAWLVALDRIRAGDLLRDVVGDKCRGQMVYWVQYSPLVLPTPSPSL